MSFCIQSFQFTARRHIGRQPQIQFHLTLYHAQANSGTSAAVEADTKFWVARDKCWRPTVSDVERISWGKPAKKKGTGSRGIPHRLNSDERFLFDQARRKGFLEIVGSGWRSHRRDSPLLNTYRSLCDAKSQVAIVLHKGNSYDQDEVVVDLSPLRMQETFEKIADTCIKYSEFPEGLIDSGFASNSNSTSQKNYNSGETDEELPTNNSDPFETRPIYHLPPYYVTWKHLSRSDAKALGKKLAQVFNTIEDKAFKSRKPNHVKPGKGRRHGGYGIG